MTDQELMDDHYATHQIVANGWTPDWRANTEIATSEDEEDYEEMRSLADEESRALLSANPHRGAARAVHAAADANLKKMHVAVQYAFARGRAAIDTSLIHEGSTREELLQATAGVKEAVRKALLTVLPGTVLKVVAAGGDAGTKILNNSFRSAGSASDEDQPRAIISTGVGPITASESIVLRTAAPQVKGKPHSTVGATKLAFNVSNPKAIKWAHDHAAELAIGLSDTTEQDIKDAVERAMEEGDLSQLRKEIFDAVGDEARVEMIARTEVQLAANEGVRQSWDQAAEKGLLTGDEQRVWVAFAGCCDECDALDGKHADLDGEYPGDGGDGPPLHPNCRCSESLDLLGDQSFADYVS